jgi:transposase InsO family protein
MNKEEIRKEYFKLKSKGHTNNQCRKIVLAQTGYEVTIRTLRRWTARLDHTEWDLRDRSRRPKRIYCKILPATEEKIVAIKKQTGWGAEKIEDYLGVGHTSINKILNKYHLTKPNENRRKRIKYIRWQREHPNSLWQMDHTDEQEKGFYTLSIIDDCSRYSLALKKLNNASMEAVIKSLDEVTKIHGYPREILTDNGSCFGLRSEKSKFDIWCRRRHIRHIRTAVHSPTTSGKVERLFQTMDREMPFCNEDLELFRMRYNHFRPHTSLHGKTPADIYFAFSNLF